MKVKDCMCNNVCYLDTTSTVEECAKLMQDNHIGFVPICDYNKNVIGLLTDRDIILRTIACGKDARHTQVKDIMTCNVCSCNANDEIENVEKEMCNKQIRRLPVIDENNKVIGIITLGDLSKNKQIDNNNVGNVLEDICKCQDKNAE